MKKSFNRIPIFFLILFSGIALLEILARQIYLPHSDMFLKQKSFAQNSSQIKTLIMGHSHLEKGLDPYYFSSPAFNLAYSAEDIYYHEKVLKKIIDKIPNAETLIIGLDYFCFGYDQSKTSLYYVKDYLVNYHIFPEKGFSYALLLNSSVFWLNRGEILRDFSKLSFRKKGFSYQDSALKTIYKQDTQILIRSGFRYATGHPSHSELREDAYQTVKRNIYLYDTSIEKKQFKRLQRLINLFLNNSKGEVIILFAPLSKDYHRIIPEYYKTRSKGFVENLQKSNPKIRFYDFSDLYQDESSFFLNADHLNALGAKHFSQYLDSVLTHKPDTCRHN